jgi:hypothetical protein
MGRIKLLGGALLVLLIFAGLTFEGIGPVASGHFGFPVFDQLSPYHCPSSDLPNSIMWEPQSWMNKNYPDGPPANAQKYLGWWAIQSNCSAPLHLEFGAK